MKNEIGTPREQICMDYHVSEAGIIQSPGKFEGQAIYVPYFWDAYLNGCADSDNGKVLGFKVTPKDRKHFPEIPGRVRVIKLMETDQGFVIEL